jgi:two-component system C4-dicarboxylate transport sensor histidine kinase DctB
VRARAVLLFLFAALLIAAAAGAAVYRWSVQRGFRALHDSSTLTLALQEAALNKEVDRFGLVPLTVASDKTIVDYLANPGGQDSAAINRFLSSLNANVGAESIFLISLDGTVLASSNWQTDHSFIGNRLPFRPYFQQAKVGRISSYYAVGTTQSRPGYYLATAVEFANQRVGIVAIKIGLEQLELLWHARTQPLLLVDTNNVVVLSSVSAWKFHTIGELSAATKETLAQSRQYNQQPIDPLPWTIEKRLAKDTSLVTVPLDKHNARYLAVAWPIASFGMTLISLVDPVSEETEAAALAIASGILILFIAVASLSLAQWRMSTRDRLAAQDRLRDANDRLEEQVAQRSGELTAANAALTRQVAERTLAAVQLQNFQKELIRTENLAVIGQLSAGLAHEINQPLAALSTLSANAVRYLERQDVVTVRHNLERINDIVVRMGRLTRQLKSFARNADDDSSDADIATSVDAAQALLAHRMQQGLQAIRFEQRAPPESIRVRCNAVRLEQVLVNLIGNAMDAVEGIENPGISVYWHIVNDMAVINVDDNGSGMSEDVLKRIFEPFFTTKSLSGLGLGLAISSDIVKSYGGTLTAINLPSGGARFSVMLGLAIEKRGMRHE